jgi:hypothetical protein
MEASFFLLSFVNSMMAYAKIQIPDAFSSITSFLCQSYLGHCHAQVIEILVEYVNHGHQALFEIDENLLQ